MTFLLVGFVVMLLPNDELKYKGTWLTMHSNTKIDPTILTIFMSVVVEVLLDLMDSFK